MSAPNSMPPTPMVPKPITLTPIAIDGPAGAGKGTLAKMLAGHFGFDHLDTGGLYRAVGLRLLRADADPADGAAAARIARSLDLALLQDPELRAETTGEAASIVAAQPAVRAALLDLQRDFAARPPGGKGAVLDGRDIGTVICPGAPVKLFVTASAEERARRRVADLQVRGGEADFATVLADIRARDARDASRAEAPLQPAPDAHLLDTTNLAIEPAFRAALALIDRAS